MISVNAYRYFRLLLELALFAAVTVLVLALLSHASAQTRVPRSVPPSDAQQTAFPAAQREQPCLCVESHPTRGPRTVEK